MAVSLERVRSKLQEDDQQRPALSLERVKAKFAGSDTTGIELPDKISLQATAEPVSTRTVDPTSLPEKESTDAGRSKLAQLLTIIPRVESSLILAGQRPEGEAFWKAFGREFEQDPTFGTVIGRKFPIEGAEDVRIPTPNPIVSGQFLEGPTLKQTQEISGLALDIGLDPTTSMTLGATKAGRAAAMLRSPAKNISMKLSEKAARGEISIANLFGKSIIPKTINEPIFRVVDKIREASRENRAWQGLGRTFWTETSHPVMDWFSNKARWFRGSLSSQYTRRYLNANKDGRKLAKSVGLNMDSWNTALLEEIERPGSARLNQLSKPQLEAITAEAERLKTVGSELLPIERNAGLYAGELQGDVDYWLHALTKEAKEHLIKTKRVPANTLEWQPKHASMLQREFSANKTVAEANEQMAHLGFKFFEDDPYLLGAIRADRTARSVAARQFIDESIDFFVKNKEAQVIKDKTMYSLDKIAKTASQEVGKGIYLDKRDFTRAMAELDFEKLSDNAKAGLQQIESIFDADQKGTKLADITKALGKEEAKPIKEALKEISKKRGTLYILPEEVAGELNKVHKNLADMYPIVRIFNATQNWWKRNTLSLFPAYHMRNLVSNIANNMLGGVYDPSFYAKAGELQLGLAKSKGEIGKIVNAADRELMELASRYGAINTGFFQTEYGEQLAKAMKGATVKGTLGFGQTSALNLAGRAVGTAIEDNARLAHFLSKFDEGIQVAKAAGQEITPELREIIAQNSALSVKKYLFDYGELTNAERQIFRTAFPFYSWTRKNLPLQAEKIITQPGFASTIEKGRRAVSERSENPEFAMPAKYLSSWLQNNYPVRVRTLPDGTEEYLSIAGYLPIGDLMQITNPQSALEIVTGNLTPLVKEPLQNLLPNGGYDLFFGGPIERSPGEKEQFLGMEMRKRWGSHVLRNLRLLSTIDQLFFDRGDGQLSKREKYGKFMLGFRLFPQDPVKAMTYYSVELDKQLQEYKGQIRLYQSQIKRGKIDPDIYQRRVDSIEKQMQKLEIESEQLIDDMVKFEKSSSSKLRKTRVKEERKIQRGRIKELLREQRNQ